MGVGLGPHQDGQSVPQGEEGLQDLLLLREGPVVQEVRQTSDAGVFVEVRDIVHNDVPRVHGKGTSEKRRARCLRDDHWLGGVVEELVTQVKDLLRQVYELGPLSLLQVDAADFEVVHEGFGCPFRALVE